MPAIFNTVGVISKPADPPPEKTLLSLSRYLVERGHQVLLEQTAARYLKDLQLTKASLSEIGNRCDLAIVVGGDGTLLHSSRCLADYDIPLLGINLGRLGFLTDISPNQMTDTLEQIFQGSYEEEERFLLRAEVDGQRLSALNDVVIHKWNTARMIEFETYVDGRFVDSQRSDGMIVSTPTGSTAYALSGGGPLLHPNLNATVMVPICPHTLSNRPIVVRGDSRIEVVVSGHTDCSHVRITCDGQTSLALKTERIMISKHENSIRLIHPAGHDHYNILRAKLGWGEHPI